MRQRFGVAVALIGNPGLLIVDEPTAGLDPAERVRFLNLLSEIGENSVVMLSTHIVEDVSELCTRMAIIDRGEILLEAEPLRAMSELRGRIWRRVMSKAELPALEREHAVISTKLLAGRTVAHVHITSRPSRALSPRSRPRGCLLQRDGGRIGGATSSRRWRCSKMKLGGFFSFVHLSATPSVAVAVHLSPDHLRVLHDESRHSPSHASAGLHPQLAVHHHSGIRIELPALAFGGPDGSRRGGRAGRTHGDAPPCLREPDQQGRVSRRAIPRRPRAQCVDFARGAVGQPARRYAPE